MGGIDWIADLAEQRRIARRIRSKALEALEGSNMREVLELAGTIEKHEEASAALKAILAERIADYAIRAMREAKKRGTKVGAATIIIAASKAR